MTQTGILLFFLMGFFPIRVLAQTVIDAKGTKFDIDVSKWKSINNDIYNKNSGSVGIGTAGMPNSNAALEVSANNKGILIPRVALTSTSAFAPLSTHTAGMIVYNTATTGTVPTNVYPGFYYNDGSKWIRVADVAQTDPSKDAWIDDNSPGSKHVTLGTLSDGSTSRPAGTAVVIKDDGKVGIGTISPKSRLSITGYAQLGNSDAGADNLSAASDRAGMIRYNNTLKSFQFHDDTQWVTTAKTTDLMQDLRLVGNSNHITQDAGVGLNGTSVGTGSDNIALGKSSLAGNTTGSSNIAVGTNVLSKNTTGNGNTALGLGGLLSNVSGNNNTSIGSTSLISNTVGEKNTTLGGFTLQNNTTGNNNTVLGYGSGGGITTGSNNTIIGAGVISLSSTLSNNIIIADGAGNRRINVDNAGNVGLNTASQKSRLDVPGYIKLGGADNTADALAQSDRAGMIRYNTTDNTFQYHNNTQWITAGTDQTKDSWEDDIPNSLVKLSTLSDGVTARPAGTEMVIKNDGKVGIGTSSTTHKLNVAGDVKADNTISAPNYTATVQNLTTGSWDLSLGANASWTLAAGNNTLTINNIKPGMYGLLKVTNAGTSTITLPVGSKVINAGGGNVLLTQTASAVDILTFYYDGTNYWWTYGSNYN